MGEHGVLDAVLMPTATVITDSRWAPVIPPWAYLLRMLAARGEQLPCVVDLEPEMLLHGHWGLSFSSSVDVS